SPGGGFRTAGKIEWKGPRSSLFRVNTVVRGPGPADGFDRSSTGIYYRFPASSGLAASAGNFPLRVSRVSLNADRNGSDRAKITDSVDGTLGLSLSLPPMLLPPLFLPASAKSSKSVKPKIYPLSVNLTASLKGLGSTDGEISPYPFSLPGREFDSSKTSCELLWSPGIFQFRTKWGFQLFAEKDSQWEGSFSAAVRFRHGRFSVKMASPVFPEKWNCTLSWRVER
ncbi:MAG: hypothetical protein FWH38_10505, partial [Treponema sp.]|nr:hypothetical protein [Treponema sp.]